MSTDLLLEARYEVPNLMERLGGFVGQLNEALSDAEAGNEQGAQIVSDDALCTLSEVESLVSDMAVKIAKWKTLSEEESA
jgi:hypothetical protein